MQRISCDFVSGLAGALASSASPGREVMTGVFDAVRLPGGVTDSEAYKAWRELFGEVVGIRAERLHLGFRARAVADGRDYGADLPAYLFALHTVLALVARLSAAASLPGGARVLADRGMAIDQRLARLDSGEPFVAAGIEGMAVPEPFGWLAVAARDGGSSLGPVLAAVVERVVGLAKETALGHPDGPWCGDLFTGLYQALVPRELRHALGEVYTPPALAAYALDRIGWRPEDELLDPTCGSGVFILEALRRRIVKAPARTPATDLIAGLYGVDLNPLAVVVAKASMVVALAPFACSRQPVSLPVFQGDALSCADGLVIPRVSHLCGNPPWVKVSQLPPAYGAAIRPVCARLNLFGDDRYVGGVELDLSAAVTNAALARWARPGTRAAFYLTASLFSTASSQGFRRFTLSEPLGACQVLAVEDFKAAAVFEGVSNHPALLLLEVGRATRYPVPYRVHDRSASVGELLAQPLPGSSDGPWLKGTAAQQAVWERVFAPGVPGGYRARKGVTTDRNGIYFVTVTEGSEPGVFAIANDPALGRNPKVPRVGVEVEAAHLFPLLRGRGLAPFRAEPDPALRVIIPQRGMHGDPDLPRLCPRTFEYFQHFEAELRGRASYRRYQQGQPFWSTWSTGPYSFSPWKVLWREISNRFYAAAQGPVVDDLLGERVVVPDHKLYFIPVACEAEAAYLTGMLNAPTVAEAVAAGAAALSLGAGVIERLRLPRFDPENIEHQELAALARRGGGEDLDRVVVSVLGGR